MIKEVCNLVKKSPSRETKLNEIRETAKDKNRSIGAFALHDGLVTERCICFQQPWTIKGTVGMVVKLFQRYQNESTKNWSKSNYEVIQVHVCM